MKKLLSTLAVVTLGSVAAFGETVNYSPAPAGLTNPLPAATSLMWTGRSQISSPADGTFLLSNNAGTGFNFLQLGGATASFPALKKNGAAVNLRLADDSGDASITAGQISVSAKILSTGSSPVVTACGTGPAIVGSNTAGTVTQGTIATGCVLTFSTAFVTNIPACVVTSRAGLVFSYTVSLTALTITNVGALSSTALDFICIGR